MIAHAAAAEASLRRQQNEKQRKQRRKAGVEHGTLLQTETPGQRSAKERRRWREAAHCFVAQAAGGRGHAAPAPP